MRTPVTFSAALLVCSLVGVSVATAATDPAKPPAGSYTGGGKDGFKINKQRTSVSGFRFTFANGPDTTDMCTIPALPTGKVVISISKALKITAAHRGGYTTYIVGRSTPSTSSGISPISVTYKLAGAKTMKGQLQMAFNGDRPSTGDGQITIPGCTLLIGFHKKR